jgi:hypothetical protein
MRISKPDSPAAVGVLLTEVLRSRIASIRGGQVGIRNVERGMQERRRLHVGIANSASVLSACKIHGVGSRLLVVVVGRGAVTRAKRRQEPRVEPRQ